MNKILQEYEDYKNKAISDYKTHSGSNIAINTTNIAIDFLMGKVEQLEEKLNAKNNK